MKKLLHGPMHMPDYVTTLRCRFLADRIRIEGPTISISGRQILLGSASI